MSDTYKVNVKCVNCGFKGPQEIFIGRLVSEVVCPNCYCKQLVLSRSDGPGTRGAKVGA